MTCFHFSGGEYIFKGLPTTYTVLVKFWRFLEGLKYVCNQINIRVLREISTINKHCIFNPVGVVNFIHSEKYIVPVLYVIIYGPELAGDLRCRIYARNF